jgi:predicted nucleic acid-binding protein
VRIALDTNILAHAEGVNGTPMRKAALDLVQRLPEGTTLLPVQTLGELFNLLVRKAKRPPSKARKAILSWRDAFPLIETPEPHTKPSQTRQCGFRALSTDLDNVSGGNP